MNHIAQKGWMECRACKRGDPCLMFMPKKLRKEFPKKYCYLAETHDDMIGKGRWKKPAWAKTELTV